MVEFLPSMLSQGSGFYLQQGKKVAGVLEASVGKGLRTNRGTWVLRPSTHVKLGMAAYVCNFRFGVETSRFQNSLISQSSWNSNFQVQLKALSQKIRWRINWGSHPNVNFWPPRELAQASVPISLHVYTPCTHTREFKEEFVKPLDLGVRELETMEFS